MGWTPDGDKMTLFNVLYTSTPIENIDIGVTTRIDKWGRKIIEWDGLEMIGRADLRKEGNDDTVGSFPELNMYWVDHGDDLECVRLIKEYLKVSKEAYMIVFYMGGEFNDENFKQFSEMETVIVEINDIVTDGPDYLRTLSGERIYFPTYTIFKFTDRNM